MELKLVETTKMFFVDKPCFPKLDLSTKHLINFSENNIFSSVKVAYFHK